MNNPAFTIHGETLPRDEEKFKGLNEALSLEDQLTVSLRMEEEMEKSKKRLQWVKASKLLFKTLNDMKKTKKGKVDRSKSNVITVHHLYM